MTRSETRGPFKLITPRIISVGARAMAKRRIHSMNS